MRRTPRSPQGSSQVRRRAPLLLMIDNYDSFTHNVVDLLRQLGAQVVVRRNDEITPEEIESLGGGRPPDGIVISPGPGRPEDAGVSVEVIRRFGTRVPILGICLGHQAMAVAYGGRVVRARRPLHGTATPVRHRGGGLLRGLPSPFLAARYHSLVVSPSALGRGFRVTARSAEGEVMAMRHERDPVEGVQFHPESFLTPGGRRMLQGFVRRAAGWRPVE